MTIPLKILSKQEFLKENPKPDQEAIWDEISVPWEKYRVKTIPIVEEFLKKVGLELKNSKRHKKGKIVDLGCGSGRNMIAQEDVEYYAVDFSSCQIANARMYAEENNVNAKFFRMGIDKLSKKDFKENMFDAGLFIASLHCLESKKERHDALAGLYRILKKDAECLITVWDANDARFKGLTGDIYMSWLEDGISNMRYYYLYSKEELINSLKEIGFKIEQIYEPQNGDRFSKKNLIVRVKK